jgi:peptidoglycan/LPS O-acetylase OafA/YrhL
VYLMHGLVGVRVWAVCGLLGLTADTPAGAAALVLLAVAGSLAAGWVLYVLVERPMARRAARVDYRR